MKQQYSDEEYEKFSEKENAIAERVERTAHTLFSDTKFRVTVWSAIPGMPVGPEAVEAILKNIKRIKGGTLHVVDWDQRGLPFVHRCNVLVEGDRIKIYKAWNGPRHKGKLDEHFVPKELILVFEGAW